MRREWLAAPGPAEAPHWAELIERCGWHDTPSARTGADRFVWDIRAHCGSEERAIELPDAGLIGAWRDLVDAVREFARTPPPEAQEAQEAPEARERDA